MQPLWNERMLKFDSTLVIADLHIGYERELEKKGINIPEQSQKMIDNVLDILIKEDIERLVINGDFKHNIPKATWQEYQDIPKAVDTWLKAVDEMHLLRGNHDGGIEDYLPSDVIVHGSSGTVIDGVGFFHGHANPLKEVISTGLVVLGHSHPTFTFRDSLDNKDKKECWVKLKYRCGDAEGKAILMPHLNHLLGGISINEKGYLGPFLENSQLYDEKVYLLDGTYLGLRKKLSDHHSL